MYVTRSLIHLPSATMDFQRPCVFRPQTKVQPTNQPQKEQPDLSRKIGQGSYGEVFEHGDDSIIKKIDRFDRIEITCLEMTTLCEVSVLSNNRWTNLPFLEDVLICYK